MKLKDLLTYSGVFIFVFTAISSSMSSMFKCCVVMMYVISLYLFFFSSIKWLKLIVNYDALPPLYLNCGSYPICLS